MAPQGSHTAEGGYVTLFSEQPHSGPTELLLLLQPHWRVCLGECRGGHTAPVPYLTSLPREAQNRTTARVLRDPPVRHGREPPVFDQPGPRPSSRAEPAPKALATGRASVSRGGTPNPNPWPCSLSLLGKKQSVRKYFNYFFETVKK